MIDKVLYKVDWDAGTYTCKVPGCNKVMPSYTGERYSKDGCKKLEDRVAWLAFQEHFKTHTGIK